MTMMNVQSSLTANDAQLLQQIAHSRYVKLPGRIVHRLKANGLIIKVGENEPFASGLYLTAKGRKLLNVHLLQSVLDEYLTAETVDLYDVITNMAEEIARLRERVA